MSATGTTAGSSTRPASPAIPLSPHYRDLFPLWAAGDYFPLLYSRPAVEAAARLVIHLAPAP